MSFLLGKWSLVFFIPFACFFGGEDGNCFLGGFASLISGVKNTRKKIEVESLGFEKTGVKNLEKIKPGVNKNFDHLCQGLNSLYWGWSSYL